MDQGVTAAFKGYYLRKIFAQAIVTTEEDPEKTLMQFWKDHRIYDCIRKFAWAWSDVTEEHMNGMRKKALKGFIHDFKGLLELEQECIAEARLNKTAGEATEGEPARKLRVKDLAKGFVDLNMLL